jgi:hypothetical protein
MEEKLVKKIENKDYKEELLKIEEILKSEELITGGELLKICFINSLKLFYNILKKLIKTKDPQEISKNKKFLIIIELIKNLKSIINTLSYLDKILFELYLIIKKLPNKSQKVIKSTILRILIIIPSIQIQLIYFTNILIKSLKEDISKFLYTDFIVIKNILKALNKSYKKLINSNLNELKK